MSDQIVFAADTHNVAGGSESFLEDAASTVKNFTVGSVVSATHSFYNTAVDLGNWAGGNYERADTLRTLQQMDQSIGSYYSENQDAVDLGGLIVGSIVPGIAVTKAVNYGSRALAASRSGFFGSNISSATGLQATASEALYAKAATQIAEGTVNSRFNRTAIAGLVAGLGEQTLMVAGSEALVATTMSANPIIEKLTWTDHLENTAVGAAFFAPVFTGIGALKGFKQMKNAATKADQDSMPWRTIPAVDPKLDDATALFAYYGAKKSMPEIPGVSDAMSEARQAQLTRYAKETTDALDTKILGHWQSVTGGDTQLSIMLKETADAGNMGEVAGALAFLKEIRRGSATMTADKKLSSELTSLFKSGKPTTLYTAPDGRVFADAVKAAEVVPLDELGRLRPVEYLGLNILDKTSAKTAKALKEADEATLLSKGFSGYIDEAGDVKLLIDKETLATRSKEAVFADAETTFSKKFLNLRGELKGVVTDAAPDVLRFADHLAAGESITIKAGKQIIVQAGKSTYKSAPVGSAIDAASMDLREIQARYIAAAESAPLKAGAVIHQSDIPFLEKAYHQGLADFQILDSAGNKFKPANADELLGIIEREKGDVALRTKGVSTAEISERTNISVEYLEGRKISDNPAENLFMYQNELLQAGPRRKPYFEPSYAQLGYDTRQFDMAGKRLDHTVSMEQMATLAREYNEQVSANFFKETYKDLPQFDAASIKLTSRYSGGQTFLGFGQGEYFSPEATAEFIGRITANETKKAVDATAEALESTFLKLANDQPAAIEFSMIMNRARAMSDSYVMQPGDKLVLKSKVLFDAETKQMMAAAKTPEAAQEIAASRKYTVPVGKDGKPIDMEVQIQNSSTAEALRVHASENFKRIGYDNSRRSALGRGTVKVLEGEIYAPPHNFRNYPHFALVRDGVTGEMSFIGAYTADDLKSLASKVPSELDVIYKENSAAWHKAIGDYEYGQTITDNMVDVSLKRQGILNAYFPKTDPVKISADIIDWHKEKASSLVRDMIKLKYSEAVTMLDDLSKQYTAAATSVARKSEKVLGEHVDDPYSDMIKTMLNVSKATDYRMWTGVQKTLDQWVSYGFAQYDKMMTVAKSPAELDAINEALVRSGYRGPLYGVDTVLAANHSAPAGVLSSFVRRANTLATNFMLKPDFVQAMNNAVGTNILLSSEMGYLISKIKQHPEAAGKLDALMKIAVPGSDGATLNAPAKLIARQYYKFFSDLAAKETGSPLISRYIELGLIKLPTDALRENFDALALRTSETVDSLKRLDTVFEGIKGKGALAIEKGELWTGNKHSEMMGRFVAAGIADDITSVAVDAGILSADEAIVAMHSFVNKVHGSTLASQRPVVFQGAVGQAISLFQSYQFNLMQQLFKYVGDGQTKSAATLLGMQTAIYGVQGIPAFNALNTHIIGTAAGNVEHRDLYTETYNVAGKELGDWLMYGLASNILGINMYSRGDLNPRQATVLPTTPKDIPFVSLSARFIGNAWDTANKMVDGAPLGATLLQGLEHIGINRPLSGLAAVIQGYTTTSSGSLVSVTRAPTDISAGADWNLFNNFGRIAGAKPLDEAILLDANYRYVAYKAKETDAIKQLGSTVKAKMLAGAEIKPEDTTMLLAKYQAAGGKQENFNRQMISWMKDSRESVINQVAGNLNSGAGKYMQRVLAGGTAMPDYVSSGEEQ